MLGVVWMGECVDGRAGPCLPHIEYLFREDKKIQIGQVEEKKHECNTNATPILGRRRPGNPPEHAVSMATDGPVRFWE